MLSILARHPYHLRLARPRGLRSRSDINAYGPTIFYKHIHGHIDAYPLTLTLTHTVTHTHANCYSYAHIHGAAYCHTDVCSYIDLYAHTGAIADYHIDADGCPLASTPILPCASSRTGLRHAGRILGRKR